MNESELKYQPNVAAILRNSRGMLLICERLNSAGAWQFPQGGIDAGETPDDAIRRELFEEISIRPDAYRIVTQRGPYRYCFPDGRTKKGCHGKDQIYFVCDFLGADDSIDVATAHPEFRAYRWIAPADFQLAWLPEWKRDVYRAVFADLLGVNLTPVNESR